MSYTQRNCVICGAPFQASQKGAHFCGWNCRASAMRWRRKGQSAIIARRAELKGQLAILDAVFEYLKRNGPVKPTLIGNLNARRRMTPAVANRQ